MQPDDMMSLLTVKQRDLRLIESVPDPHLAVKGQKPYV